MSTESKTENKATSKSKTITNLSKNPLSLPTGAVLPVGGSLDWDAKDEAAVKDHGGFDNWVKSKWVEIK